MRMRWSTRIPRKSSGVIRKSSGFSAAVLAARPAVGSRGEELGGCCEDDRQVDLVELSHNVGEKIMGAGTDREGIYIQYGCGFSPGEGWLNFDNSPTLRIERVPVLGRLLSFYFSGNRTRFPSSVRYGDICRGLPVANGIARGVYASHVLEHLSLDDLRKALLITHNLLSPGGIFRLVVPDLQERAKRYIENVGEGCPSAAGAFLRTSGLGQEHRPRTLLQYGREIVGGSKHLWMWDEYSMAAELRKARFTDVRRCEFGDSTDPMFIRVESYDRFFDRETSIRECALEARRPNEAKSL